MSEILCRWINDEVQLSRTVSIATFAEDFSSGYLLGELLDRYGMQEKFDLFRASSAADVKLSNFKLLAPSIRKLEVPFSSKLAAQAMQAAPGVANRLVYQLFVSLHKVEKAGLSQQMMRINNNKETAETLDNAFFERQINKQTPRQVDLDYRRHENELVKKREATAARIVELEKKEQLKLEELRKEKINASFERSKKLKIEFNERIKEMEAGWAAKAAELFATNAARTDMASIKTVQTPKVNPVFEEVKALSTEVERRQGSPGERLTPLDLSGRVPELSNEDVVARIGGRRKEQDVARSEREKRRRRAMLRQQDLLEEAEAENRRALLLNKVLKRSQAERRIAAQLVQTRREEAVIVENRVFRELQHRERQRKDFEIALQREADLARLAREENRDAIDAEAKRLAGIKQARVDAAVTERQQIAASVASDLVDLACKCAEIRGLTEKQLPPSLFREWKEKVVKGVPLYESRPEDAAIGEKVLDITEFDNYCAVRNEWELSAKYGIPEPSDSDTSATDATQVDAEQDNAGPALLSAPPHCRILGHVLHRLKKEVDPVIPPPMPQPYPKARLRAAVVGKTFAGKSAALKAVAEQAGVTVIVAEDLITEAISAAEAGELEPAYREQYGLSEDDEEDTTEEQEPLDTVTEDGVKKASDTSAESRLESELEPNPDDSAPTTSADDTVADTAAAAAVAEKYANAGDDEAKAASKIQAGFRGMRVRKQNRIDPFVKKARAKFSELDADGSGTLEGAELGMLGAFVWDSFHVDGQLISDEEKVALGEKIVRRVDADADSIMSFDEFAKWFKHTAEAIKSYRVKKGLDAEEIPLSERAVAGGLAAKALTSGEVVSADVVVKLVTLAIRRAPTENGWVLDGFPSTLEQAKALEKALTGFDENATHPMDGMSSLVPVADDEQAQPMPRPKPGIDGVVLLDLDDELCIRRALGRRIDPQTGILYHIEGLGEPEPPVVPSPEEVPCDATSGEETEEVMRIREEILGVQARLAPVNDASNNEDQLQHRLDLWRQHQDAVLAWYAPFEIVHTVDASADRRGIIDSLMDVLDNVAETEERIAAEAAEQQLAEDEVAEAAAVNAEGLIDDQLEVEAAIEAEVECDAAEAAATAAAKAEADAAEKAADPKAFAKKEKAAAAAAKKAAKSGGPAEPDGADLEAFIQKEETEGVAQVLAAPPPPGPGKPGYAYASDELPVPGELARALHPMWGVVERQYRSTSAATFSQLRESRDVLIKYLHTNRVGYADFLTRPDTKQEFVVTWQQTYNDLPRDMRDDEETKAELHQRAEDLQELLWNICDTRKDSAQKEIDGVRNNGFIQDQTLMITNYYTALLQAEVDRYQDTQALLNDFYAGTKGDEIKEVEEAARVTVPFVDISPSGAELIAQTPTDAADPTAQTPSADASNDRDQSGGLPLVPRTTVDATGDAAAVEAAAAVALKSIPEREDPAVVRAAVAEREKAEKEAAEKAAAKTKPKKGEDPPELLAPPTVEELGRLEDDAARAAVLTKVGDEQFVALTAEDDRFKMRVELLRRDARRVIDEVWAKAGALWTHMEACLALRYKTEVASVSALIAEIRAAIEAEERLLHELVLDGQDFFINRQVYMYEPPVPDPNPPPAKQPHNPNAFSVQQIRELIKQFVAIAPNHRLPTKRFIDLLRGLSALAVGNDLLPESWLDVSPSRLNDLVTSISGGMYVDWRQFILAACAIPSPTRIELQGAFAGWAAAASQGVLTAEQYAQVPLWFEGAMDGPFPLGAELKQIVYDLFASDGGINAYDTALWLCRAGDPREALQVAVSVIRDDMTGEMSDYGSSAISVDELHTLLNHGLPQHAGDELTLSSPVGRDALLHMVQRFGEFTLNSVLNEDSEVRDVASRRFSYVDANRFGNPLPLP